MSADILSRCVGFEWDVHNADKIRARHDVATAECEQLFFNRPLVVGDDVKHSEDENRFYSLGQTDAGRLLFLVFTVREDRIRVISVRDMSRKERRIYEAHEKEVASIQE